MKRRILLPLAGAAVLAAFSVAALPFSRGLFRAPRTPYGGNTEEFMVRAWVLCQGAAPLVPRGASVFVRMEPPDPAYETHLHRWAVGLLPGRKIIPAALWGAPSPVHLQWDAQYEIVMGQPPQTAPGVLLLEIPEGTVWRRGT